MTAFHSQPFMRVLVFSLLSLCPTMVAADNVPREIGGIALGSNVDAYPDIIKSNFLNEVVVTEWHGFRKGVISYGTCRYNGQILKIDMKYEDKTKDFFKTVLEKLRKTYGEPTSWKGDSFGVMLVWKWNFIDSEGIKISLTLQHNEKNSNETMGNVIKLSYPDRIEEERLCFANMCDRHKEQTNEARLEDLKKTDWSYLLPR